MGLEISDPKDELWTKTEFLRRSKKIKINFQIQNVLILSSPAKSEAPDRLIRSVSSSQYERNIPKPFLMTFLAKNDFVYEKTLKFPHFYRLARVLYLLGGALKDLLGSGIRKIH